jgi:type II secretory pathway pseudopilin PulG
VVLVIMGIILGVTGPRFVGSLGGSELTRFTKVVAAYLRNAREMSVVRNAPVKITIREENGSITCTDARNEIETLSSIEIPEWIEVTLEHDYGYMSEAILFYPLGNATGNRVIIGADNGEIMTIAIDAVTGEVSIE